MQTRKDALDSLVLSEFAEFESDPLGYLAERERGVESLADDGYDEDEARRAWREFEKRYLTAGDGGLTLSAHGLDRAVALGEELRVDEGARTEIVESLDGSGALGLDGLRDDVGVPDDVFEQSLWTLRRRGIVDTKTSFGDVRVVLKETARSGI